MNWIKIKRDCPMPDIHQPVLIMHTNADDPTCALLTPGKVGKSTKPIWVFDQSWEDVETDDGTQVTHWCAIEPPKE